MLRKVFAYAASDHVVYLRGFSERAADMKLVGKLIGHTAEVMQVSLGRYMPLLGQYRFLFKDWMGRPISLVPYCSNSDPLGLLEQRWHVDHRIRGWNNQSMGEDQGNHSHVRHSFKLGSV